MERWKGRVAVVTGASSTIGSVIVKDLINAGLIVVAVARRVDRIKSLRQTLIREKQQRLHYLTLDVTKEQDVNFSFNWMIKMFGGVDILINGAGIFPTGPYLSNMKGEPIRRTIDINIVGVITCIRKAFESMKSRNVDGHIILMNSVCGHYVPIMPKNHSYNIYPPTKHAITAIAEIYRQEFPLMGTKIKITSITPGLTDAEIIKDKKEKGEKIQPLLQAQDISNSILYALSTPPKVHINEIVLRPLGEKF
ncbi:farnesol dehydrogenase-like [Condylostylus longicornis]|uniref:farnesol dehydrogenase-like n=1 Tax=Condylostylus longicornis TaxID=2530218 RepID=UPI00244E09E1|nr:farnesol dehydrogenase-like [Condylostylus longicornis]